ncbi:2OG-Fe(II) oxygenase family protein [Streptomyces mangrovi]|uniref:hypothetical protein n=1 Tax=Streptomyces mangrovi TaxID=1206892 RepID=UPI00399D52E6
MANNTAMNPAHLTDAARKELHDWFRSSPTEPKVFQEFLRPELARSMAEALRCLPVWERHSTAHRTSTETEDIPEEAWDGHPRRAARHFVARALPNALEDGKMEAPHQKALRAFLAFAVMSGGLQSWLEEGIGVEIDRSRNSLEFAAYKVGDSINVHQDLLPGRILAVNFYLDDAYRPSDGARLGYRNEEGREFRVDPLFNSFALIPILPDCHHWVDPYEGATTGRFTVSIGQHQVV